jgi:hypothetical protein
MANIARRDYCSRSVNQLMTARRAAEPRSETSSMTLARLKGTPTARSAANKMITRPATTSPDIHSAFGIPRVLVVLSLVVSSLVVLTVVVLTVVVLTVMLNSGIVAAMFLAVV